MIPEIEVVILAGGDGQRMGHLTQVQQKCMLPVEGKPILAHILEALQDEFGSARIVIATGYKGEAVQRYFGTRFGKLPIDYVHSPESLGVRRRLMLAEKTIKQPFLVVAGDEIIDHHHYGKMVSLHESSACDLLGVISASPDHHIAPTHSVVYFDSNDRVTSIQPPNEFPTSQGDCLRGMSLWFFKPQIFSHLKDGSTDSFTLSAGLNQVIIDGVGKFVLARYTAPWYHFVYPQDVDASIRFIKDSNLPVAV